MKTSSDRSTHLPLLLVRLVPATALLALLACASAGPPAHAAEPGSGLQVTVMIYSGRPNPTFSLDDEAAIAALREAVEAAEVQEGFDRETVVPSILGYNGVRIENRSGVEGLPEVILIYGGTIELRNGGKRFLADPGRELERGLIEQATERDLLDDAARSVLRDELGKGPGTVS